MHAVPPSYVFIHVPRTGGSSIWHSLADAAIRKQVLVCDLYHESMMRNGTPEYPNAVLAAVFEQHPEAAFVFHHHTAQCVSKSFQDRQAVFATVLRDPIERFISDVFHYRRTLSKPDIDPVFAEHICSHWGDELTRCMLQKDRRDVIEILDIAATDGFFQDYYVTLFSALSCNENGDGKNIWPRLAANIDLVHGLALQINQQMSVIADYSDLDRAYVQIAKFFNMQSVAGRLDRCINVGYDKPQLSALQKRSYERLFNQDYQLLDHLKALREDSQVDSTCQHET